MDLMKGPYRMVIESPKKRKIVDEKGILQYFDLIRLKHPAFVNQYKHFMAVIDDEEKPRFTIEDEINMHMVMKDVVSLLSKKDSVSLVKMRARDYNE